MDSAAAMPFRLPHRLTHARVWALASYLAQHWVPLAVAATILAGLVYGAVQQDMRQTANDPQIQMAEDTAEALARGTDPHAEVGPTQVDMARSLAPYLIIFDASGHVVAGSVQLDGEIPQLPPGVFDYLQQHVEDRLT